MKRKYNAATKIVKELHNQTLEQYCQFLGQLAIDLHIDGKSETAMDIMTCRKVILQFIK